MSTSMMLEKAERLEEKDKMDHLKVEEEEEVEEAIDLPEEKSLLKIPKNLQKLKPNECLL